MKKLVSMRTALSDNELLGDALKGDTWSTWRVLLIAAVGEELTEDERQVFKTFTGRDVEPGQMVDTFLAVAGRRSGKRGRAHTSTCRPASSFRPTSPSFRCRQNALNSTRGENVWQLMRDNWLRNRIFQSYDDLVDHCCHAWNMLVEQPWRIMSIGLRHWPHRF